MYPLSFYTYYFSKLPSHISKTYAIFLSSEPDHTIKKFSFDLMPLDRSSYRLTDSHANDCIMNFNGSWDGSLAPPNQIALKD